MPGSVNKSPIVNSHAHVFTIDHVPPKFLPSPLTWLLKWKLFRTPLVELSKVLAAVFPGITIEEVKRYKRFMDLTLGQLEKGKSGQEGLYETLKEYYPQDTRFVLLSMDMAYMGAGEPEENFEIQLRELAAIKEKWGDRVYPFIAVDPRRNNHMDLVKEFIEKNRFTGVKLYPPLGYWPSDERLMTKDGIYAYCMKNNIPIVTHASVPESVRFRGAPDKDACRYPGKQNAFVTADEKRHAKILTNPDEYRAVLNKYPGLKICFAHFGGNSEWEKYFVRPWDDNRDDVDGNWVNKIRKLIAEYENVYADVSYTWATPRFTPLLKLLLTDEKILKRVLFGSDFYMVEKDVSEREASIQFRYALGEDYYSQIARINPLKFLGLKL